MGITYWRDIGNAFSTLWKGLQLTLRHILQARQTHTKTAISDDRYFEVKDGLMTVQYPHESIPVPDNGRYRLHNEIDDCIVCDKCAKVCPVDCIEIESIRAVEEFGKTSDGTSKRIYAARFDIDMGKCCFCGLCTTVCPTECLTMTKTYDFSEYDVDDHIYSFANMTPLEILEKKQELEKHQQAKTDKETAKPEKPKPAKPAKPMMKPKVKPASETDDPKKPRPKIRPKPIIPKKKKKDDDE
ncbi:MAG: 4Fe-4S dicluster domain-containing protein [Cyclobacteriaceae bacterium]